MGSALESVPPSPFVTKRSHRWWFTWRDEMVMTRHRAWTVVAFVLACLLPVAAHAQSSFTGVVKDTSGAVLPGVTVEAASPLLIEKMRSAVTDSTGSYRIVDLMP